MSMLGGSRGVHTAHLWPTLALAFLSWIVLLAGLSSVQDECRSSQTQFPNTSRGFIQANNVCSGAYRYSWWILWLSFAVILATGVLAFLGHLSRGRVALCSFLAFTAALLVIQTDGWLSSKDAANDAGAGSARITTTFVGFLLTTIFTLALIISVGTVHDGVDGVHTGRGTTTTTTSKV